MNANSTRRAVVRLVVGAAATTAVWCGLLPQLLEWPPIARHVALMEERRVDPAAMYYTELDHLPLRPAWVETLLILWPSRGTLASTAPAFQRGVARAIEPASLASGAMDGGAQAARSE